jgi:hypothetical protein
MIKTFIFTVGMIHLLGWAFAGIVYLIAWTQGWWP